MWLSDYKEAIEMMEKFMGNTCWYSIHCSPDGSAFVFKTDNPDTDCWVWIRGTNIIKHIYADTWRNPEHSETFTVE